MQIRHIDRLVAPYSGCPIENDVVFVVYEQVEIADHIIYESFAFRGDKNAVHPFSRHQPAHCVQNVPSLQNAVGER